MEKSAGWTMGKIASQFTAWRVSDIKWMIPNVLRTGSWRCGIGYDGGSGEEHPLILFRTGRV
jgi:hypothetical protein